jgi:hypothetical protein
MGWMGDRAVTMEGLDRAVGHGWGRWLEGDGRPGKVDALVRERSSHGGARSTAPLFMVEGGGLGEQQKSDSSLTLN